jgi:hypothetical protein
MMTMKGMDLRLLLIWSISEGDGDDDDDDDDDNDDDSYVDDDDDDDDNNNNDDNYDDDDDNDDDAFVLQYAASWSGWGKIKQLMTRGGASPTPPHPPLPSPLLAIERCVTGQRLAGITQMRVQSASG